jgi:hypothetical protein
MCTGLNILNECIEMDDPEILVGEMIDNSVAGSIID